MDKAISDIQHVMMAVNSAPQTMIHNDCNPRNICLRLPLANSLSKDRDLKGLDFSSVPYPDLRTLCIYDWELATIDVPQRDVAEFLSFVLMPSTPLSVWIEHLDFYRQHLLLYSGLKYPFDE